MAKIRRFVGIDPGFTQFNKRDVWLGGLSTGMIINHNFTIGLSGRGWTNSGDLMNNFTANVGLKFGKF